MSIGDTQGGAPSGSTRAGFPSLNQRIFAPFKLATVIDAVTGRGITPDTILERTGLSLAEVRDPHTLTSIGQYLVACENIVAAGAECALRDSQFDARFALPPAGQAPVGGRARRGGDRFPPH